MKQKVSLARALVVEPELILMDEPFGAFDIYDRERLQKETLKILKETNKSIVFVTHNIDEALTMGQKIVLFSERPSRVLKIFTNMDQKDLIVKELKSIIISSEKK